MRKGRAPTRDAPTGEKVVGKGVHPHPNLPPSKGKGGKEGWVPSGARATGGDGVSGRTTLVVDILMGVERANE